MSKWDEFVEKAQLFLLGAATVDVDGLRAEIARVYREYLEKEDRPTVVEIRLPDGTIEKIHLPAQKDSAIAIGEMVIPMKDIPTIIETETDENRLRAILRALIGN